MFDFFFRNLSAGKKSAGILTRPKLSRFFFKKKSTLLIDLSSIGSNDSFIYKLSFSVFINLSVMYNSRFYVNYKTSNAYCTELLMCFAYAH